jgi:hypothetical protein
MKLLVFFAMALLSLASAQQVNLTQQLAPTQQQSAPFVPDVILLSDSSFSVPGGYSNNISMRAVNRGNSQVENVVIDVPQINSSVFVEGTTQKSLGALSPGEEKTFSYVISSPYETAAGNYFLPINVSYLRHNRPFSYTTGVGVSVFSADPMFSVSVSDKPLQIGIGGEVRIEIRNIGNYTAYNTYATMRKGQTRENQTAQNTTQLLDMSGSATNVSEDANSMIAGSARTFLGDIKPGSSANANYTIVPEGDMSPGAYSYELELSLYPKSANQTIVQRYPIGIVFEGRPRVYLSSIEVSVADRNISISGDANNIGSEIVKYAVLETTENDLFAPAYSGSTYYVGTLEPDDFIPFELKAMSKASNTEPQDYDIRISYMDSRNREISELFTVTIPPQPPQTEGSDEPSYLRLVLLVVVIVIVVLLILWRRRRNG